MQEWPHKDPDETLDYKLDWRTSRLGTGETLAASSWILPTGIVQQGLATFDADSTTIWLSGGTLGKTYRITNRVTTDGDRTMDWTIKLDVLKR